MVAVAHRRLTDSIGSGFELAEEAAGSLSHGVPAWGLLVVGGQHDGAEVLASASERLGGIPIVGGACVGTITTAGASYSGFETALMLFGTPPSAILRERGIAGNEYAAGRRLGVALSEHLDGSSTVLLFYDTPRADGAGLVVGSELLDGIYSAIGEATDCVLGAGLIGDPACTGGFIYTGDGCERDAVVAVVLPAAQVPTVDVMHGILPLGAVHEVTAAKGTRIHELDGRPAVQVLMDDLGISQADLLDRPLAFSVLLGRRADDVRVPPSDTEGMLIRLIVAVDPQAGWVQLFESDLGVGDRVEVMLRDPHGIFETVAKGAESLRARADQTTAFGLYIDCAGRIAPFSGTEEDEATVIAAGIPPGMPFLGFYVGREIAPIRGRSRPHDWSGVLLTMARAA